MRLQRTRVLPMSLLLVAGTVGCGRKPQQPEVDEPVGIAEKPVPPENEPRPKPTAPYIERLVEAEKCFDVAGFETHAYRYSGGFVEGWVEVQRDGEKKVLAKVDGWQGALETVDRHAPAVVSQKWVVTWNAPRSRQHRAPGILPGRVHLPVQPAYLAIARQTVLPPDSAGRRGRNHALPGDDPAREGKKAKPQHIGVTGVKWIPHFRKSWVSGPVYGVLLALSARASIFRVVPVG